MLSVVITILLLVQRTIRVREPRKAGGDARRFRTCPLCGEELARGEKVRAVTYPGKIITMTEVHGCPHCHGSEATNRRVCPVCRNIVPPDGYVVGKMFTQGERTRLHVVGCTDCIRRK